MTLENLVLIDTCIWVSFFNRPQSETKRAVDILLDEDRAGLINPVLTEVLCGFRRDAEADWVSSVLRGLQYLEILWNDWREAASIHRQLAARNHILPMSDLVIATIARRCSCSVYTMDPHFDLIPDLRRFRPGD